MEADEETTGREEEEEPQVKEAKQGERKTIAVGHFPASTWNQFAGYCRSKGLTIRAVLEDMIKDFLRRHGRSG